MDTQLLWDIIIAIGIFIFLTIVVVICIFIYAAGKRSVKDTDERAYIHIDKDGHIRRPIVGIRAQTTQKGIAYIYNIDNKKSIVIIPASYEVRHYLGKRDIYIGREGQLIASPFNSDIQLSNLEKDDLFHSIFKSKMLVEAVKHISGKGSNKSIIVVIIIIAAIVVVVGIGGGYYAGHQTQSKPPITQPTQTQPVQPSIDIQGAK